MSEERQVDTSALAVLRDPLPDEGRREGKRRPRRIQRRRTKGWRMPRNTIYVGRPTEWGNPFKVGDWYAPGESFEANYGHLMDDGRVTDANVLSLFEEYARRMLRRGGDWLSFLRGKDLACWCEEGAPCHADVLLRLANS